MISRLGAGHFSERAYGDVSFHESLPVVPRSALDAVVNALGVEPQRVLLYNETPHCQKHDCTCSAAQARWWEMLRKNHACFRAIQRDEAKGVFAYDWVLKTRADTGNLNRDFGPPQSIRGVLARSALESNTDRMFLRQRNTICNAFMDMHALMPRSLAPVYFNLSKASCKWQRCLEVRYAFDERFVKQCLMDVEENLIVEWVLWHGIDVAMLPPRPESATYEPTLCGSLVDSRRSVKRAPAFLDQSHYACDELTVNNTLIGRQHLQRDHAKGPSTAWRRPSEKEEASVQLLATRSGVAWQQSPRDELLDLVQSREE